MRPDFVARLVALADHWNSVERRIKQYEHIAGSANTAAINELRYAGRKVMDLLAVINSGGDEQAIERELIVAENYIVNADHDVTDGICFVVMRRVSNTIDVHGLEKIKQNFDAFSELYPNVSIVQEIVQNSRERRKERKNDYEKIANEYLPELVRLYTGLKEAPSLRLRTDEEIRRLETGVTVLGLITVISGVFSILSFFLTWLEWAYPNKYWEFFWSVF